MSKSCPSPSEGGRWRLTEGKGSLAVRGLAHRMGNIDFFFFWPRLREPCREAAGAYWSRTRWKCISLAAVLCPKEGGHKRLFELRCGIESVYWFATLWRDDSLRWDRRDKWDWVPLAADKRRVALWMDWTENAVKKKGNTILWQAKIRPIHADTHTNAHPIPKGQGECMKSTLGEKKKILSDAGMHLEIHPNSRLVCPRMIVSNYNIPFIICFPLVYSNRL